MNIGFFSECWDPQINGVVTSTKALSQALEKQGDRVFIFAPRYPAYKDTYPFIFRQFAVNYIFQPEFYFSSPLPYAALRAARGFRLDLIHLHTEFTLGLVAKRVALSLGIPSVLTLHTLWEHYSHYFLWDILPRNLFRFFLSRLYLGPDYFIAPSSKAKDYLEQVLKIKKPIAVIPTGIELANFNRRALTETERKKLRAFYKVKDEEILLMFAGRIGKEKSINIIIEALCSLKKFKPQIKLLLVGDGPYLIDLKKYAQKLDVAERVIFTGYIRYESMPKMYQLADIFIMPSISETQGLVTVEALASGLPVIIKNDPASFEIIAGGKFGLVFYKDSELPELILRLINSPSLKIELARKAPQAVLKYNTENYGRNVRNFYQFVLKDFAEKQK